MKKKQADGWRIGLEYVCSVTGDLHTIPMEPLSKLEPMGETEGRTLLTRTRHRMALVHHLTQHPDSRSYIQEHLERLAEEVERDIAINSYNMDPYMVDLVRDIRGQLGLAVSRDDWFHTWGRPYLASASSAHAQQQCNNFKDPSVQHYGGALFQELRKTIDDVFCRLPAPKSRSRTVASTPGATAVQSMRTFNNSNNPCFAGECVVQMASGGTKLVQDIRPGDTVATPGGSASVRFVLSSLAPSKTLDLVTLPANSMHLSMPDLRIVASHSHAPPGRVDISLQSEIASYRELRGCL